MSESWFQLPGDPIISVFATALAKIGGLYLLLMIVLMVIRYYVSADSLPVNAIRRGVGIALAIPFASAMTRIFGAHFHIPDQHFETLVFLIFVSLGAALAGLVNHPSRKEPPYVSPSPSDS